MPKFLSYCEIWASALSVSGSYLFSGASIGNSLMNLTQREIESAYCVGDFMTPIEEAPHAFIENATTKSILECVETAKWDLH